MSYQVSKVPVETNHVLHILLTFFTCGLWAPVWIVTAIINASRKKTIVTQTYPTQPGAVLVQQLPPPPPQQNGP